MFSIWEYFSVGNVLLAVLFLLLVHQLVELYAFKDMPPGPRFPVVPFLGHALQFDFHAGGFSDATKSFRAKYGRVYSFKLGKFKMVVAGNPEAIKEVLVTKSGDYAGRPQTYINFVTTSGGKDILFGNFGPAWKLHRKLFAAALRQYLSDVELTGKRVSEQARKLLDFFEEQKENAFDPTDILAQSIANIICGTCFGEGFDTSHPDMKELLDLNQQIVYSELQRVVILDYIPFMEYLPIPAHRQMLSLYHKIFGIIQKHLKEHRERFDPEEPVRDLISGLIHVQHEARDLHAEDRAALLSDDYLVNTIEDMFVAGYETTSTTLKWVIAFLVNYPQYQTDIQHQLDEVVGRDRMPNLQDRHNLPLLHATIMEVLRVGNVAPQTIPHLALKDTSLCGYRVPKDSVVIVDIEAVHLDPECWANPRKFDPYRHIDKDGNLITNQDNFYPFGAGRRVCAGEPLAKVELFLFLSWMLHKFTFAPEENQGPPELKGLGSIINSPKPYKIRIAKRE